MPNEFLSQEIKEAYAYANDELIETLEITHPSIDNSIYIYSSNSPKEILLTLEDGTQRIFLPLTFKLDANLNNNNGNQSLPLVFDNSTKEISEFIKKVIYLNTDPVKVIYRPYLASDLTTPHYDPPLKLNLSNVVVDNYKVTATADFIDFINKAFPLGRYSPDKFPSLV